MMSEIQLVIGKLRTLPIMHAQEVAERLPPEIQYAILCVSNDPLVQALLQPEKYNVSIGGEITLKE